MLKEKSLTRNSIYYLIYQILNVVFPFLTGMYVARVLFPEAVGRVSYAQNIAQYFVILSFLGIPTYGLREISKARSDQYDLNKVYSELMIINFFSTVVFYLVYLVVIILVSEFRNSFVLYMITGSAIAFNALNNSWLYEGIEEFEFISIRNIAFKLICFVLLIMLVTDESDYLIYASITVFGIVGNYLINVLYANRYVTLVFHGLSFRRHIKPVFSLVMVNLAIELYSLVDVTMIGLVSDHENVAYYSYGSKIYKVCLQVINTFTMVIVPRMALYYKEGMFDKFNQILTKAFKTILALSVPMILGIWIVSRNAIVLLYGIEFLPSVMVLRILTILLLISPTGYLLGSRVLLVSDQESKMILCVSIGAIVNIIGNALLISKYAECGAAVASVLSETCVMCTYVFFGRKVFKLEGIKRDLVKIIAAALIMSLFTIIVGKFIEGILIRVFLQVSIAISLYFIICYILREDMVSDYAERMIRKLLDKRGCNDIC